MPIISAGRQHTLRELDERAVPALKPSPRREAAETVAPPPQPPQRIGIVFVHGIGSQQPGETLLDWSRPLVKILTEWRQRHDNPPDPVIASRIDFTGSEPPIIQLDIPRLEPSSDDPVDYPAQTWYVTEAWWASNVRPPSLGTMVRWLVTDFGRVVSAIQAAADKRRHGNEPDTAWAPWWVGLVDRLQSFAVATLVGLLWFAGAALGLPYALIRGLPLVGDRVAIAQLDAFLVDWFGDLRILLHDPAQAANIRGRLAESLSSLRDDYACTSIVLVAHSGGVIVSLTTLSDPLFARSSGDGSFPVTKLLTIGQGMGLAWNLWDAWKVGLPQGDRLLGSPYAQYSGLRWLDFWGTYDPAPAGKFKEPITPMTAGPKLVPTESRPVWNRMSFREDHGGYWDNDEQFVIPLLQEIDTAAPGSGPSRFFRDRPDQERRVARRIERVAVLGWWRWLVGIVGVATIVGAWFHATGPGGGNRLGDIGAFAAKEFATLPGHEVGSGPLDAATNIAHQIGEVPVIGPGLALLGQAAVVLAVLLVVATVPGWYGRWRVLSTRVDRGGRLTRTLKPLGLPAWLPPRIAVAVALYGVGAVVVAVGSGLSIGWVLSLRSWLADRVRDVWTSQTGNAAFGAIVIVLVFVAIEAWGASRWKGWDERERWMARIKPLPDVDRSWVWIQALGFGVLLGVAFVVISLVEVH